MSDCSYFGLAFAMPAPASVWPRKIPRQSRSLAVVDAILEAAARILERDGLAGLNTNILAEKAGVSVGSVYQYFPSKEAVVAEILRRKRAEMLRGMRDVLSSAEKLTFEEAITAMLSAALSHQLDRPELSRALEYAETMLPIDAETRELKIEIAGVAAECLRSEGFRQPEILARDITALCRGMIDSAGLYGETDAAALQARLMAATLGYLDRMRQ
ncbi:TetR/AcrR family transcriptional regulator [Martelella lutilitoris]|uniref:TetR/AcrR family transcriptional regulator n=1 Tax=Martelella lutilitoris TaxID=2583532 RepID=A0A5C4JSP5_9HYPH|nr:TetR/AcrR family transcriptional regulator [Martelella lutilitoris]TNB48475.1 TetR/AcrR family transcriptional regulator [Martelella lutilitoris]